MKCVYAHAGFARNIKLIIIPNSDFDDGGGGNTSYNDLYMFENPFHKV